MQMTGRKNHALQVTYVVPYKALGNFPKALYGTKQEVIAVHDFSALSFFHYGSTLSQSAKKQICLQATINFETFFSRWNYGSF